MNTKYDSSLTLNIELNREVTSNNEPGVPYVLGRLEVKNTLYIDGVTPATTEVSHINIDSKRSGYTDEVVDKWFITEDQYISGFDTYEETKRAYIKTVLDYMESQLKNILNLEVDL